MDTLALYLLPVLAGSLTVMQAGLNRRIGAEWGLTSATLLNGVVLTAFAAIAFFVVRAMPQSFPELFVPRGTVSAMRWWWIVPGIIGFFFVLVVPYAFARLGAGRVFTVLVAAQIVAGVLWDYSMEGNKPSVQKLAGAALAVAGAALFASR